jgi:ABC-type sugar transport system substrate-binding protein
MALGVSSALDHAGTAKKVIVGIDGVSLSVMRAIKEGKIDSSFTYPLPAKKALELVAQILKGQPVQKKYILPTMRLDASNVDQYVKENPYLVE